MESIMAQVTLQRQAAWNAEFITADGESFAGLYIAPNTDRESTTPGLTFKDILDCLLSSFTFELSFGESESKGGGDARPCAWTWALMPYNGIKDNTCVFPGIYGVQETLSMDLPFKAGKYYLVRHHVRCSKGVDCYGDCYCKVIHATPEPPRDYRPFTPVVPAPYNGVKDNSWNRVLQESCGPIAEGVTGVELTMKHFIDNVASDIQHWRYSIAGMGNLDAGFTITHVVLAEYFEIHPVTGMQGDIETPAHDEGNRIWDRYHRSWISRFWAIEPETLTIRVFAPYDILIPYHGNRAYFPDGKQPEAAALRWHYRMCVYESLTARSAILAWSRELKDAAAASVREIESAGRRAGVYAPPPTSSSRLPKRKLESFNPNIIFSYGGLEHCRKVPRKSELHPDIIEGFTQKMSIFEEFSRKLGTATPPRRTFRRDTSSWSSSP